MNVSQQVLLSLRTARNAMEYPSTVAAQFSIYICSALLFNFSILTKLVSRQMVAVLLISLCIGVTSGFRGPHHPKSSVSHHHYVPQSNIKLTQDTELLHDATHLKEDMGPMGEQLDFSKMTAQEIEFHYFKVHDVDNNTKLDGLELLHAIQHSFHENRLADVEQGKRDIEGEDDLPWIVGLIDKVLKEDDLDNDGYLGYIEYVIGRQRDRVAQSKRKPKSRIEG